jgi:type VI secretion system protein ImpJ
VSRPLQRVVWKEGMFMSPQHLQAQDAYHELLLAGRLAALSPYPWGVLHVVVDQEALRAGQLQLLSFSGILPDGTPLAFDKGHPEAPPLRPLADQLRPGVKSVEVYLGVPKERDGLESYAQDGNRQSAARYLVQEQPVADRLSVGSIVPVAFAQRNTRLLFGNESRDDFEALQIAELTRDGLGASVLEQGFVPPSLRIDASPWLLEETRKCLQVMLGKQQQLADARKHRDASTVEFTPGDVKRFLQLHALDSAIPVLNHMAETGEVHPHALYLELLRAAGALSTFVVGADLLALPKFQYTRLGPTFADLFATLQQMLQTVERGGSLAIPLELRPSGVYIGKLDDERVARAGAFILAVKSEVSEQQVTDQLPRLSKIASTTEIARIVQAAAPGVPLQINHRPPNEVAVRPGVVYFNLATDDPYWKNALRDRAVAIYLPQPFDPSRTKIELLAIPGR